MWYEELKDLDYKLAAAELRKYAALEKFPPKICDIRECLIDFRTDKPLNSSEAWALVLNTLEEVEMSGNAKVRYEEFPDMAKTAIGGYPQFREWANNPSFNKDVARSGFVKVYQHEEEKEEKFLKLQPEIRRLILKQNEVAAKQERIRGDD